jgi:cytoskeletal protein CcmA (bactofilin family)
MSFRTAPAAAGQQAGELAADVDVGADMDDDEAFSLIDRHTTVDGTLSTERDLRVDGQVLGTLQCGGVLFVAEGAEVDATVEAGAIVVSGTLSGTIVCRGRLEIRPTGAVHGTVQTGTLVIQEGALYEGQLKMEAPPQPEPAAPVEHNAPVDDVTPPIADEQPNAYSFLRRFTTTTNVEADASAQDDLPAGTDPEREGRSS